MADCDESLVSHLEHLRKTLIQCFSVIGIVFPIMYVCAPKFLNFLIKILVGKNNITLNYFSPAEVFLLQIKVAMVLDIIFCFPFIAKKIWDFVLPALYDNEKKFIKSIVFVSSFLFIFGVLFCLFFILPLVINFGMSFMTSNIKPILGISNVVDLSLWLSLAFGVMFQFPILVHSLIKSEIVSYETIKEMRPYVVVVLLILAGILTPPDVLSQVLLFIPTYALFELGLLFSKR